MSPKQIPCNYSIFVVLIKPDITFNSKKKAGLMASFTKTDTGKDVSFTAMFVIILIWMIIATIETIGVTDITTLLSKRLFTPYFGMVCMMVSSISIFYAFFKIDQKRYGEAMEGIELYILFAPAGVLLTIEPITTFTIIYLFTLFLGSVLGSLFGILISRV